MNVINTIVPAPLDGITVIEIDNWMAAPSAGAIMADLGARVIKVEPLTGDPMRNTGRSPKIEDEAMKAYDFQFDVDNRGKESICIDLT
ncbi:MAG: CoA transferase, partial [Pseudomonadales bacterium]